MKKLLESIDSITGEDDWTEAGPHTTIGNAQTFIRDIAKAFDKTKGTKLNITVTLQGTDTLSYRIEKISPSKMDPKGGFY